MENNKTVRYWGIYKYNKEVIMNPKKIVRKVTALFCSLVVIVSGIPATTIMTQAATLDFYDENSSVMLDRAALRLII